MYFVFVVICNYLGGQHVTAATWPCLTHKQLNISLVFQQCLFAERLSGRRFSSI